MLDKLPGVVKYEFNRQACRWHGKSSTDILASDGGRFSRNPTDA